MNRHVSNQWLVGIVTALASGGVRVVRVFAVFGFLHSLRVATRFAEAYAKELTGPSGARWCSTRERSTTDAIFGVEARSRTPTRQASDEPPATCALARRRHSRRGGSGAARRRSPAVDQARLLASHCSPAEGGGVGDGP